MSGKYALVIGNTEYTDSGLAQLTAPGKDAEDFARVLKDQNLCCFDDVKILVNQASSSAIEAIDEFFDQRKPDDMLVLYFSGHGIRDEFGSLYLAFKNTIRSRLRSTAIKDDYIRGAMDQSRSKRQVVILDCCNSGAFPQGTKAELGGAMGLTQAFQGYGRFVLTASDSTQFAWEGDKVIGETDNSLFTHFLVKGLEGEADTDGDGKITVDDLYEYTYEEISKVTEKQTPTKSATRQEGEFILRQITRLEDIKFMPLPEDLVAEIEDPRPYVREPAVKKLESFLKGKNLGLARSARQALEKIAKEDDSRTVASTARKALEAVGGAPITSLEAQAELMMQEQKAIEQQEKEKAEEIARKRAEAERIAQAKAEALRNAREKERQERIAASKAATTTTGTKAIAEKPKHSFVTWKALLTGGITIFLAFGIVAGILISRPGFSLLPTEPLDTKLPSTTIDSITSTAELMTETAVFTLTPLPSNTPTPLPTFTHTFTPVPTVTPRSLIPIDPADFIVHYFDTVIVERDIAKGWSLLTPAYQTNKAQGWAYYSTFWGKVKSWDYSTPEVEYNNNIRALVMITYTLFYENSNTKPDVLPNVKYCLLWEQRMGHWQIDLRDNCR